MFSGKFFTTSLVAGALLGSVLGAAMEPMMDKKKLRKSAGNVIHTVGDMVEGNVD